VIMGHELVVRLPSGELVAVDPQVSCQACDACRDGHEQRCERRHFIGIDRPGGFAERVAVPLRSVVPVSDGVPAHLGAFAEPLAVALHAFNLGAPAPDTRLGVIGGGAIGLSVALCAQRAGIAVELAETSAARRAMARDLGVVVADVLDGSYPVVVDAVGSADSHRASLAALRRGGTAVWVGNVSERPSFDARELVRREHRIVGASAYTHREFTAAAAMLDAVPEAWVEQRTLDDGVAVFGALLPEPPTTLKVVLTPSRQR
jgi:threonine dehydrogenase-like Zn-dependent dehydrogenase